MCLTFNKVTNVYFFKEREKRPTEQGPTLLPTVCAHYTGGQAEKV